jgi:hypothetical protein
MSAAIPSTFTSRYTTLALIHAGDAAARSATRRKVNAHGIFELLVQLAALPRLGTPPMSGRQATPHRAAAKSLALRQRVLGASQSTGSSSHSPTSREAKRSLTGCERNATPPPSRGGQEDRRCETPPDSDHHIRGERLQRKLADIVASASLVASARGVRREFIVQRLLPDRLVPSHRLSSVRGRFRTKRRFRRLAQMKTVPESCFFSAIIRVICVSPLLFARRVGHTFARSMFESSRYQARPEQGKRSRHHAATSTEPSDTSE